MLRLLKHETSYYFASVASIHIYNHLNNQLINQLTISEKGKAGLFFSHLMGGCLLTDLKDTDCLDLDAGADIWSVNRSETAARP
jgi:hypothetical protein